MEEIINRLNEVVERQVRIEDKLSKLLARETPLKDVMDSNECAEYLGLSVGRVRVLVAKNEIPFFKHANSNRNYFRREDIDNWRANRRVKTNRELEIEAATDAALKKAAMTTKRAASRLKVN